MAKRRGRRSATSTARIAARRLAGLYRAARAALVTPLRDGMNLVAKEYVASQDMEDPGVLILSRFAGAAIECKPALAGQSLRSRTRSAPRSAARLSMPLEERRARQSALMQALTANDIQDWPDKFLAALTGNGLASTAAATAANEACRRRMHAGRPHSPSLERGQNHERDRQNTMGDPGRLYSLAKHFAGARRCSRTRPPASSTPTARMRR